MEQPIGTTIDEAGRAVGSVLAPLIGVAIGVVAAYLLARLVGVLVVRVARRHPVIAHVTHRCRRPFRFLLVLIGAWAGVVIATPVTAGEEAPWWRDLVIHGLVIAVILATAWLLMSVVRVAEDAAFDRYRLDSADNGRARRVHTQVQMLRRLSVALIWVVALAAILMTFPGARAFGASVLASAGLASIVAGLAAQSALANVFAGMQLAFTDAIRVEDVVIVEGENGRIEEITLTYVVVHLWDDRRMILPSTYFTTTPFQNWTRRAAELLGTVEMDLDWRVPVAAMRAELAQLLAHTDLWDQRVGSLQVTEAVGGVVRVRVLLSAPDAGALFDLRCFVREGLVDWLQREAPYALPRTRFQTEPADEDWAPPVVDDESAWGEPGEGGGEPAPEPGEAGAEAAAGPALDPAPVTVAVPAPVPAPVIPPAAPGSATGARPRRTPVRERANLASIERDSRFYTGTIEGMERAKMFRGPGEDVIAEREETAERAHRAEDAPAAPAPAGEGDEQRTVVLRQQDPRG
ncbi:mechanosensitive ion channel family protein [Georgenia faecalis]|uniref:Mechanosensitive ion channel family protein n=1 Tax=Georgenia faecalis TaxID=2483799 RepID=A0ABV9DE90_9MICO|nr:mechanosensitive ion channel family protein [Georgenia faecalis]